MTGRIVSFREVNDKIAICELSNGRTILVMKAKPRVPILPSEK